MKAITGLLFAGLLAACSKTVEKAPVALNGPVKIEQAEKEVADGTQLLDVRTAEEWKEGHLKGAKLITVTEDGFLDKSKAALDPKKPVLVYCKSGKRSEKAAKELRDAGFTSVLEVEGGISAWQAAGKPVTKD